MTPKKLFAVYLGGRAPKGNTELHDVVFAIGENIEATYEQLIDKWFGTPQGLHLDSWMELDIVDGHRVTLVREKPANGKKLFFINLGACRDGVFGEAHDNGFVVASNVTEAKTKAKKILFKNWPQKPHTDNICDIDDCIELCTVDCHHIVLEETNEITTQQPTNGYHLVPKDLVCDYMERNGLSSPPKIKSA